MKGFEICEKSAKFKFAAHKKCSAYAWDESRVRLTKQKTKKERKKKTPEQKKGEGLDGSELTEQE